MVRPTDGACGLALEACMGMAARAAYGRDRSSGSSPILEKSFSSGPRGTLR
ncbi:hypothetical protein [Haloterrigena alkaliphila]|uniref:Uncharacterized protein n=1 Tax=Haloterrigena alkaliphila TaxID=2816475 RepID=A0A8A2VJT1_9EURY|nr:hypothetical protein [Haloterrigena alkaliphila]QSX00961.1 hypothetical protein J0X25_08385 [Haloterrigena alkaliphila]